MVHLTSVQYKKIQHYNGKVKEEVKIMLITNKYCEYIANYGIGNL